MDFPPVDVSAVEQPISLEEFDRLSFSAKIRDIALHMGTPAEHSETVTWDHKFGYILRFEVVELVEIDKPADEFRQTTPFVPSKYKIITRYAVSTTDGEKYLSSSGLVETSKL